jgi:hypothetical protein
MWLSCTYVFLVLFVYLLLLFCSYFVVLCYVVFCYFYYFVCTSVGLLPPAESAIVVVVVAVAVAVVVINVHACIIVLFILPDIIPL